MTTTKITVGFSPYIIVDDPELGIAGQRFPNEIVIPMQKIRVEYSYPLNNPCILTFESNNPDGFTRAEIAQKVSQGYQKIYREEDEFFGKTDNVPGMLNRDLSKGPYGIWGHQIGDLIILYEIRQVTNDLFSLEVDS